MTPQSVGLAGTRLTVGKLSGRRGLQGKLKDLGFELEGEALDAIYRAAIALADVKKEVTDADLVALVGQQAAGVGDACPRSPVALEGWSVTSSHGGTLAGQRVAAPRRREPLRRGQRQRTRWTRCTARSMRPWSRSSAGIPSSSDYEIRAVCGGEDAQGQVLVRARRSTERRVAGETVSGHGLSTNIIEASLEAYVDALEKLLAEEPVAVTAQVTTP